MRTILLISLGSALGANARFLVSIWVGRWRARRWRVVFPISTLLVNTTGSFLLGFLLALLKVTAGPTGAASARALLGTGFLGAYTTFSTFSYETVAMLRRNDHRPAVANLLGTVAIGLICSAVGVLAGLLVATLIAGGRP